MKKRNFFALLCSLTAFTLQANILYVHRAATGNSDGSSWTNAFTNPQDAIAASKPGDEIWIAAGTYTPDKGSGNMAGDRDATFRLQNSVALYGGFNGTETLRDQRDFRTNVTELSGDLKNDDTSDFLNKDDNIRHVITIGPDVDATLDGFTVRNGNADSGLADLPIPGGAIIIRQGSLLVNRCIITKNFATASGGGIYNGGGVLTVKNSVVSENRAGGSGGGVHSGSGFADISGSLFKNNTVVKIGEIGGGIAITHSDATIVKCRFFGNSAVLGGGLGLLRSTSSITNCQFGSNQARVVGGGGVALRNSSIVLCNTTFAANGAKRLGGGLYLTTDSTARIINSTFHQNTSEEDGSAISSRNRSTFSAVNSIVWKNIGVAGSQISGTGTVESSLVEGGFTGGGNISADPLFIDADGADNVIGTGDDNLRLLPGSSAIDRGNNNIEIHHVIDLAGNPRTLNDPKTPDSGVGTQPIIDMGAYEFLSKAIVQFLRPSSSIDEFVESHDVKTVLRTPDANPLTHPISVDIARSGSGSATLGLDYQLLSKETVLYPIGSKDGSIGSIQLSIIQDSVAEGTESIQFSINNIQGNGEPGPQITRAVLIRDDDKAPTDGLVGHWRFDELSWNGLSGEVVDSSPRENHGFPKGEIQTAAEAKIDRSGNFDGVDDAIDLGVIETGTPLQLAKGGTITAWFKQRDGGDRWQRILEKSSGPGGVNGYSLIADPLGRSLFIQVNKTIYRTDSNVFELNKWTHVAAIIRGDSFTIYVNGEKKAGTFRMGSPKLPSEVETPMRVGNWNHTGGRAFNGLLDDLRIFNIALEKADIDGIISEANMGLVGHWKLDETVWNGSLGEVTDSSTLENHGVSENNAQPSIDGKIDGAGNFDGVDDAIDLGVINVGHPLQLPAGGTITAWFKQRDGGDRWQRILEKSDGPRGVNGYSLVADPVGRSLFIVVNKTIYRTDSNVFELNKWTHVAAVIRADDFAIYVNGEKKAGTFRIGTSKLPPEVETPMRVGKWNHANSRNFNGLLDDIRIYNVVFPANKIKELFNEAQLDSPAPAQGRSRFQE